MTKRRDQQIADGATHFAKVLTEKAFSQSVIDLARVLGWRVNRTPTWRPTGTTPGVPDLMLVRGKRLVFAELKAAGGRLSEAQRGWLNALYATGAEVYIWKPANWNEIEATLK